MLALHELGYRIAVPFGENVRYDLVVDDGNRLQRVQCKTGRLRAGVVEFRTASSYAHHPHQRERQGQRHYRGQIDTFAVYCPDNARVYLVPIEGLPSVMAYLRVQPPRNAQRRLVRTASDYEVGTIVIKVDKHLGCPPVTGAKAS